MNFKVKELSYIKKGEVLPQPLRLCLELKNKIEQKLEQKKNEKKVGRKSVLSLVWNREKIY